MAEARQLRFCLVNILRHSGDENAVSGSSEQADTSTYALGWIPMDAEVGDIVCVVHGLQVTMVIRPDGGTENTYRFVGPCVVQGFMFGQGVEEGHLQIMDVFMV